MYFQTMKTNMNYEHKYFENTDINKNLTDGDD